SEQGPSGAPLGRDRAAPARRAAAAVRPGAGARRAVLPAGLGPLERRPRSRFRLEAAGRHAGRPPVERDVAAPRAEQGRPGPPGVPLRAAEGALPPGAGLRVEEGVAAEEIGVHRQRLGALVDEVRLVPARREEALDPAPQARRRRALRGSAAEEAGDQGVPVAYAVDELGAEELPQGRTPELPPRPPAGIVERRQQPRPP